MTEWTKALSKLKSLEPPPGRLRRQPWDRIEDQLGFALPSGYKATIDTYGAGSDGIYGIELHVPFHRNRFIDCLYQTNQFREINEARTAAEPPSTISDYVFYPDDGGLIAWARDAVSAVAFWDTRPADPDEWPIVTEDFEFLEVWAAELSVPDFLVGLYDGSLRHPFMALGEEAKRLTRDT